MKRLVLVLTAACALLVPAVAAAHPLGNFTINKFARVEVSGHRLYVRYVVDMAEIPTLQRVPVRIGRHPHVEELHLGLVRDRDHQLVGRSGVLVDGGQVGN